MTMMNENGCQLRLAGEACEARPIVALHSTSHPCNVQSVSRIDMELELGTLRRKQAKETKSPERKNRKKFEGTHRLITLVFIFLLAWFW
jgi:hypothetical protein